MYNYPKLIICICLDKICKIAIIAGVNLNYNTQLSTVPHEARRYIMTPSAKEDRATWLMIQDLIPQKSPVLAGVSPYVFS